MNQDTAEEHLVSFADDLHFKDKLGWGDSSIRTQEGKSAVLECINIYGIINDFMVRVLMGENGI